MNNSNVSKTYFQACERIHDAADMLYESLHEVNIEIDLVREICKEHENELPF